ncbi:hypothetical protein BJ972_000865 [Agromyces atrinae]|uniref:SWIM zinc finger family protein n=2 Tax=Agromyces atrinae TaxID=592376 RepID=A0A4Q2M3S5_9MICO|nr:SWIM zinc finger family protein [Agromyces atrinae]NYD66346.1 hypothetical protein [Agromyces atrinae]RXZ86665.1 SWIM zinc finger family protein [Agromyces atrinae]
MNVRAFVGESTVTPDALTLALAPALTPAGIDDSPSFFHGFASEPQTLARGLVVLADITATRYFQYTPESQRDPVLTAQGDRLRAECFSACNGVYARLDILQPGLDGGEIGFGTTNVDISAATRRALVNVARAELLHLDVGRAGLAVSTPQTSIIERPVEMPSRWVRALGNVAELHRGMTPAFSLDARQAQEFIASLPSATSTARSGWLAVSRGGVRLLPRDAGQSVHIAGLHRLSALKRLLPHARGATFFGDARTGAAAVAVDLPGARVTLGVTDEAWRGHSGEGSLLEGLADASSLDDAELISAILAFEPVIDVDALIIESGVAAHRVRSALAVLAASGRVGWDVSDRTYFHRELPDDTERVTRDNPRLVSARRLVDENAVRRDGEHWAVYSHGGEYRVHLDPPRCTCAWYLRHGIGRGPCKHLIAARIVDGGQQA